MRETVRRHWIWYLLQGGLMVVAVCWRLPVVASVAVISLLGWVLIARASQGLS
jgi:uncharacterized membrane protein HdeD (DUF308 family)